MNTELNNGSYDEKSSLMCIMWKYFFNDLKIVFSTALRILSSEDGRKPSMKIVLGLKPHYGSSVHELKIMTKNGYKECILDDFKVWPMPYKYDFYNHEIVRKIYQISKMALKCQSHAL